MTAPTPMEVTALMWRAYLAGRRDGIAECTDYQRDPGPPATGAEYAAWREQAMQKRRADLDRLRAPKHPWCPDRGPCPDLDTPVPSYGQCMASWGIDHVFPLPADW